MRDGTGVTARWDRCQLAVCHVQRKRARFKTRQNKAQLAYRPEIARGGPAHLDNESVVEGAVSRSSPQTRPLELEDGEALWEQVRVRLLQALERGFHAHLFAGLGDHWDRSPCRKLAAPHCADSVVVEQRTNQLAKACLIDQEPLFEQSALELDVALCELGLPRGDGVPSLGAARRAEGGALRSCALSGRMGASVWCAKL